MPGWTKRAVVAMGLVVVFAATAAAGELRLGRYFSDQMVLQRDKPTVIRGTAKPGATVEVSFAGQSASATAGDDGAWAATLKAMPASAKGQSLTATAGGESATIRGVLVGDVFLFARQTSIDVSLGKQEASRQVAATPNLRVVQIKTIPAASPRADLADGATAGWQPVTPAASATMSAAAYHLARGLAGKVDVPVGVIDLNMGGHFPIGWLSREALAKSEELFGNGEPDRVASRLEKLREAQDRGEQPNKEVITTPALEHPFYPAAGYNAVLHPLRGVAMRGAIVQLGGNYPYVIYANLDRDGKTTDRAALNDAYRQTYDIRKVGFRMDSTTTPRIPRQWRRALGDADLPIGLVLAPGSALTTLAKHATEMRELQRRIARDNPNVGVIVPGMDAVPLSVQPADEKLLADRCLRWALGAVYARDGVAATGPVFEKFDASLNTATVYFKPGTAAGLRATADPLVGFEVAGVEGDYSPATAEVDGEVVRLESDTVGRITRVRFNWAENPGEPLVNAAGLPAIPFRSEDAGYNWFHTHKEDDLPIEYFTPANEWTGGDVTLVNGQLKKFGYMNFASWLGPVGVRVGPFGPNMAVREVLIGSPAEGKLRVGDVIYRVNGRTLEDDAPRVMSNAITQAESRAGGGKLVLNLRRGDRLMEVELALEVMGDYSPTYPYECPKTEKIVTRLERWLAARGGADKNFLESDLLFLLGAGSPEYQGLVRRHVYRMLGAKRYTNNWYLGYDTILLAEYYLATGDKSVLPALEKMAQNIADNQIREEDAGPIAGRFGGWYGNNRAFRNYPAMPQAGLACMIGMTLVREAGVPIDEAAYQRGLEYFRRKGAPVGYIIYGDAWRDRPSPLNPKVMEAGHISSDNGKLSLGAELFELAGERRTSHYLSLISSFAFNHTYYGHGGNFWNNFWTPLGANVHSKDAFLHFMAGHQWYRELNRMFDGSLIQNEGVILGGGTGLALVVPEHRLRITGAPASPFASQAPDSLGPALAAYAERDYAGCEKLVHALLAAGTVPKADRPTVEKLADEARRMQASIHADLSKLEKLVAAGRFHEAKMDLPQLRGVVAEGDARLAAVEQQLAGKPRDNDEALFNAARQRLVPATARPVPPKPSAADTWTRVVTTRGDYGKPDKKKDGEADFTLGRDAPSAWRLRVVESRDQAPDGWMKPGFDDAGWTETELPMSWRLNHTALLRTTFNVDDAAAVKGLRFNAWVFRQQDVAIYLNGELIGRINNIEKKTGNIASVFNDGALKPLRTGENTLAIATRQNWRWGMLFMKVYNDGFDFRLEVGTKK